MVRSKSLLIALLLPVGAFAQSPAGIASAKLALLREAVIFYSHDTALSKNPVRCEAATIAALRDCARNMPGVPRKLDDWNGRSVQTTADLRSLRDDILKGIALNHEERRKLKAWPDLEAGMQSIIDGAEQPVDSTAAAAEIPPAQADSPVQTTTAAPVPEQAPAQKTTSGPDGWTIAALILALAALIKSFLPSRRPVVQETPPESRFVQDPTDIDDRFNAMDARITIVQMDMRKLQNAVTQALREAQPRTTASAAPAPARTVPRPAQPAPPAPAAPAGTPILRYAKTADRNGFEVAALSDEPDTKKIFEISVDAAGRDAIYRVTPNRDAQMFALANPSVYLSEATEYEAGPTGLTNTIVTNRPGVLELQGDRWVIVSKAQISFA